jgi:hypothetical protein
VYGDIAIVALGGGAALGGFALVRADGPAASLTGVLIAVVAVMLSYRAVRLRWARRRSG